MASNDFSYRRVNDNVRVLCLNTPDRIHRDSIILLNKWSTIYTFGTREYIIGEPRLFDE